ncbi:hypothetical protein HZY62_13405 [Maribacter polysiphoniae]|uniref:GLPGLI family protein n=2 Tax=Maribacter polysiphoniae TaxID=429344 RepID=A0ABR7W1B5_9FLAO|nr:hypothetical protein [Maribacter polysiphoniae]MBD1261595.1 hypothetical protein [Maribacter polysiphoniae]
MKKSVMFLVACAFQFGMAQTNNTVEDFPLRATDLVLFSFGMDNPLTIGTISDSGEITFNFPKDLNAITDDVKANFMSDTAFTLFSKCDNSYDMLSEDENGKAVNAGQISLSTKENPYSGLLSMVTDEALVPWLEDTYSNNAVTGSYFELVYMESDFNYQGECTSTVSNTENDTIITTYSYDLQLKAGFNFIEYKIESVLEHAIPSMYEEGVFDNIMKPSKIKVTSTQSVPPTIKWIGKYF